LQHFLLAYRDSLAAVCRAQLNRRKRMQVCTLILALVLPLPKHSMMDSIHGAMLDCLTRMSNVCFVILEAVAVTGLQAVAENQLFNKVCSVCK
jgi:hypothetical protein